MTSTYRFNLSRPLRGRLLGREDAHPPDWHGGPVAIATHHAGLPPHHRHRSPPGVWRQVHQVNAIAPNGPRAPREPPGQGRLTPRQTHAHPSPLRSPFHPVLPAVPDRRSGRFPAQRSCFIAVGFTRPSVWPEPSAPCAVAAARPGARVLPRRQGRARQCCIHRSPLPPHPRQTRKRITEEPPRRIRTLPLASVKRSTSGVQNAAWPAAPCPRSMTGSTG